MVYVDEAIAELQARDRANLMPSTQVKMYGYYRQLKCFSENQGIYVVNQDLSDRFVADDKNSRERHQMHLEIIRKIDRIYCLHLHDHAGYPLNPESFPSEEDTVNHFQSITFPIDEIEVSYLIVYAGIFLRMYGLSDSTYGQYVHSWILLRYFCDQQYSSMYSDTAVNEYLKNNDKLLELGKIKQWKWKINRKSALVLRDVAKNGEYSWHLHKAKVIELDGDIETTRIQFRNELKNNNFSKNYIDLYDYVFRQFMEGISCSSLADLKKLQPDDVILSVERLSKKCNSDSMSTLIPMLRKIIQYLHSRNLIDKDYSGIVISGNNSRGNITPYIKTSDAKRLIDYLESESRRNKAIVLLAVRLGLRDCDICNLQLKDINWEEEKIHIIQQKTGIALTLPLLTDIGNSIYDYILNERPESQSPHIFLRAQAPFQKMESAYSVISGILKKLDIHAENREVYGTHLCRYTVAHFMLEMNVRHQVITDVLGHTSKNSDKAYLSIEENKLRRCALDCSKIGIITWKAVV